MKWCKQCNQNKSKTAFTEREDGWGLYDWCDTCRTAGKRFKVTGKQRRFIKKTRMFFLRPEPCPTPKVSVPLQVEL